MGRLSVVNFISLDGVIQSPLSPDEDRDGGFDLGGWVPPLSDATVDDFMSESTLDAGALLLGRRSYEIMSVAWADADPSEPAIAAMNRMPKYVVTSSQGELAWSNSRRVEGELPTSIESIKRDTDGALVVFGAGALCQGLAEHDLVDEYRLLLFPVVLGDGKRMFGPTAHPARFELTGSVVAPSGVVILSYARAR